jgi:hypothetical protein
MKKILVLDCNEVRGKKIQSTLQREINDLVDTIYLVVFKEEISKDVYAKKHYEAVFLHHNNLERSWIISALEEKKICNEPFNSPSIVAFSGEVFGEIQPMEGYNIYNADKLLKPKTIEKILKEDLKFIIGTD